MGFFSSVTHATSRVIKTTTKPIGVIADQISPGNTFSSDPVDLPTNDVPGPNSGAQATLNKKNVYVAVFAVIGAYFLFR